MNISNMTKVTDVNKRSRSPDLKYSEQTNKWTMNESIQDALNLGDSHGLNMYMAVDEETGEDIILLEIVDSDDSDFFRGQGNVFTARRLADAVNHHSFALHPVDEMDGEFYMLVQWEGESQILSNPVNDNNDDDKISVSADDFNDETNDTDLDLEDADENEDEVFA